MKTTIRNAILVVVFLFKATPIYLLVLRAQEVGNEPFWNKKKVEKCDFFYFFQSLTTRAGSDMFLPAYSQLNKINQSINPCNLKGGRYTSSSLRLYYSNDSFL